MDLALYLRVLWRFRLVVLAGIVVGTALALLSTSRVTFEGGSPQFTPRTERGLAERLDALRHRRRAFPGDARSSTRPSRSRAPDGTQPTFIPRFADPGRLSGLAVLYAELAKSDEVRRAFLQQGAGRRVL